MCTDRNVVYGLLCNLCDKTIYVGETERSLKERIEEHLRDVRSQNDKPIMKHFTGHSDKTVSVVILKRMYDGGRIHRQLVEEQWIKKLRTKFPQGCNIKMNV